MKIANVIVDISIQKLDKTFDYIVPKELEDELTSGMKVRAPFGNREITGYVYNISDSSDIKIEKLKSIISIEEKSIPVEFELMKLAQFMRDRYGCTLNQAIKTVLPAKRQISKKKTRVTMVEDLKNGYSPVSLNKEQKDIYNGIIENYPKPALIHGITGSGKTEIYMEIIDEMIRRKKSTILLIPEISLTMQNLLRFSARYGDRVGIVNSRLSAGEKYEIFEKAKNGMLDVVIGPRSALFTPFKNLGMIIIDECHDNAYFSESTPRYVASEVALARADISGAGVILGSATPLVSDYKKAKDGIYDLYKLNKRAVSGSQLPQVSVVDLREELKSGNKTIFSRELADDIRRCLDNNEQIMLFLNRRGFAGFVNCRSCGHVIKCPHCDVSLTSHYGGKLVCHYCGYEIKTLSKCPECGSNQIAAFGLGTEKLETMVKEYFPDARVLRMDLDTTSGKAGHSKILKQFVEHKADILIGTQMIVKGHDFPLVTLVGVVAADLSLYSDDYLASERTFELITQAAGRAGRRDNKGKVVIQTYNPDNPTIIAAASSDYETFYEDEITYRKLLEYPPEGAMLSVIVSSEDEALVNKEAEYLTAMMGRKFADDKIKIIGPADANVKKIKDKYRKTFYIKHQDQNVLLSVRNAILDENVSSMLQMDII